MPSEAEILADVLRVLGARTDVRVWRNSTGAARFGEQVVRFGLVGSADIIGLLAPEGRFLAVEVKAARGRQSEQQRRFEAMVTKFGGVYVLVRSAADALSQLQAKGYCK